MSVMFVDIAHDSLADIERKYQFEEVLTDAYRAIDNNNILLLDDLIQQLTQLYISDNIYYDDFLFCLISYAANGDHRSSIHLILSNVDIDLVDSDEYYVQLMNRALTCAIQSLNHGLVKYIIDVAPSEYYYDQSILMEALLSGDTLIIEDVISSDLLRLSQRFYNSRSRVCKMMRLVTVDVRQPILELLKWKSKYYRTACKL